MLTDEEFESWYKTVEDAFPQDPRGLARAAFQAGVSQFESANVWRCYGMVNGHVSIWHGENPKLDPEKYITKLFYVKKDI